MYMPSGVIKVGYVLRAVPLPYSKLADHVYYAIVGGDLFEWVKEEDVVIEAVTEIDE